LELSVSRTGSNATSRRSLVGHPRSVGHCCLVDAGFLSVLDDDEQFRQATFSLLRSLGSAFETFPSAEQFLKSGRSPHQNGDPICSIQHFGSGLRCFCIIRARVPQCSSSLVGFVSSLVARTTEGDEVFLEVTAQLAAPNEMVDLKLEMAATMLAAPSVALQHLPAQLVVVSGIKPNSLVFGEYGRAAPPETCAVGAETQI
jgi:hypothetical protein